MAKCFSSLCCGSCCGLLSPSPPQPLQQGAISSPPNEQAITGRSSTSSPSQPSKQEAVAGTSSATMTDLKSFLQKFNDISQINGLVQVLEELLKIASGEKSEGGSNSAAASYIEDGQRMLEMVDKRIGKRPQTKNSTDGAIAEIEKVIIEALRGAEKIPTVGIALSMLGSVLARFSQMSDNKSECLEVLRRMVNLGKQILQLNEQIPEQKQRLNEGVQCIVVGTTMCISQLTRLNVFRFFTATVNADSLKDFQLKIDRLCGDNRSLILHELEKRVPRTDSDSQKLYAYQRAVGIERGVESIKQLLDLNAQDAISIVVVVYGFGGIGKTTLADAAYANIDLQSYKHCRIHMDQDCTNNDLKSLQEQILCGLFRENLKLRNCDEGQGRLWSFFKNNPGQPLFLYIDNGLKCRDLEQLLPKDLESCLPPRSRILVTTRNLQETDIFGGGNIQRRQYDVNPLPLTEARELLLKKVSDYNDEENIQNLLQLCGGVPLLLELTGSQLAINTENTKNLVLEMLKQGKEVNDISDRMVGFVYDRLLEPVQEAFLDITSFFYDRQSEIMARVVGEEEFRALEAASFIKTSGDGGVIVHDIVRARGKKLSEGNRITDRESLWECLKDEEKLKNLKGIRLDYVYEQPPIEINLHHLTFLSNLLRVLCYRESQIIFREKCHKSFQQLRYLKIPTDVSDIPMEFEKLEHLVFYEGPYTQGMSLCELPPSLHYLNITDSSDNGVAYSNILKFTPASPLVRLRLDGFKNMQRLPDGVETLTRLEDLMLINCPQLRELPSKLRDLSSLRCMWLWFCHELKELPPDFGQLNNLRWLWLFNCLGLKKLPPNFGLLKNLNELDLGYCSRLEELPSDFGQLKNLNELDLRGCSGLEEWPSSFGDLTEMKKMNLRGCSSKLKESVPHNIKATILL